MLFRFWLMDTNHPQKENLAASMYPSVNMVPFCCSVAIFARRTDAFEGFFVYVCVCTFPRCNRIAASKAGLANHVKQKHQTQASIKCQYCGLNFKPQGIFNHKKSPHLSILCTYLMVDECKNSVCVFVCVCACVCACVCVSKKQKKFEAF